MKTRLIALTAALVMLCSIAYAAEYTPLDQKLMLQIRNGSGLNGTLTFESGAGTQMSALDAPANVLLGALLPKGSIEVRYLRALFGANKGREELRLTLKHDGQEAGSAAYVADSAVATLSSTLLGSTVLAFGKGDATLGGLLGEPGSAWPRIEPLLIALNGADNDWRKSADAVLERYSAKISAWMQGYTRITTQKDAQQRTVTRTSIAIPAAALKEQVKRLLNDVYQDAELMRLLQQRMSAKEAAAYLDANMLQAFSASVDALKLNGDVAIERVFDATGAITLSTLTLPLGGYRGIDVLETSYEAIDALTGNTEITLRFLADGAQAAPVWSLVYSGGAETDSPETLAYKGTLTITAAGKEAGYTVGGQQALVSKAYAFNLNLEDGKETYQQTERGMSGKKEYAVTLLVTPQNDANVGAQSFRLNATLSGLSDDRAATSIQGSLVWTDMKTDGSYTLHFQGNTAAPWNIPAPDLTRAVRPDGMSPSQLAAFRTQLSQTLQQAVAGLSARFLVPAQ